MLHYTNALLQTEGRLPKYFSLSLCSAFAQAVYPLPGINLGLPDNLTVLIRVHVTDLNNCMWTVTVIQVIFSEVMLHTGIFSTDDPPLLFKGSQATTLQVMCNEVGIM